MGPFSYQGVSTRGVRHAPEQGKMVYTAEASDPETQEGFHSGGVYVFLPAALKTLTSLFKEVRPFS